MSSHHPDGALAVLGWTPALDAAFADLGRPDLIPARVAAAAGGADGDNFVFVTTIGTDTITDFQDALDRLKVHSSVADELADFTIAGNGTTSVLLSLVGSPGNTIALNGAAAITISAADFLFY